MVALKTVLIECKRTDNIKKKNTFECIYFASVSVVMNQGIRNMIFHFNFKNLCLKWLYSS